ncbi:MAG: flagellar hook-basal body complex protein FliE [Deltaproteobacteria bacterium]|nr:MAG: flagellar hook-basal body complex protein FliE [Deltaproteobacteria bacterium]
MKIEVFHHQKGVTDCAVKDKGTTQDNAVSFSKLLKQAINEVDRLQKEADQAIKDLATDKQGDLQRAMIAIEKAEISFQLMMQVRNKIIAAYEEIMRMQI